MLIGREEHEVEMAGKLHWPREAGQEFCRMAERPSLATQFLSRRNENRSIHNTVWKATEENTSAIRNI